MKTRANVLLLVTALAFVPTECCPAADVAPQVDRAYKLRVVLSFAENRFLTTNFKDQTARDVHDQLQLAFGPLADVEVVPHHPLLAEVQVKGLQQALDGWQELSDVQTHIVLVDYRAGRYVLSSRMHDGTTGLNSPTVKHIETGDRGQAPALAARLVYDGLGVAGVVRGVGQSVDVVLQGGGLGVDLNRWVRPGDVFAVTRIVNDGEKLRSIPLNWALVRISSPPKNGMCRGEYLCRFDGDRLTQAAVDAPGVAGYRCLKLAVVQAPLRLRFIDAASFRPLSGLQLHIGRNGFQETVREISTDLNGLAETRERFDGAAFVKVLGGGSVRAQLPVALVDEDVIVCRLKLDPQAETLALLQFRRDEWLRRILEALLVASARSSVLNARLGVSLDAALKDARSGLENVDRDLTSFDLERRELQRQATAKQQACDLTEGNERLEELRRRRDELAQFVGRLEGSIQESKSSKTLGALKLLEQARLLEGEAEYDQAISLYDEFLKQNAGQKKIKDYVDGLKRSWQVKGQEHAQARTLLCQAWPGFDIAGLKANLDKAKQALKTCREQGDTLTPRKLLRANLVHVANLKKRLTVLQQQGGDNAAEARIIAEVADGLRQLHEEATAFIRQADAAKQ